MWAGRKIFSRGGNRAGSKKKFWEGGIGRGEKILSKGGIGQGRNFSDHIFLKFYGGGYAWGTKKKFRRGMGVGKWGVMWVGNWPNYFLWGGNRPGRDQIFRRGNRAGSKKKFLRGGNRVGRKNFFWEGGIGQGAKKIFERGNRAGRKKNFQEGGENFFLS